MTNVKLKLMFFLLNALLIVQARPYSDNTTDIIIKFNTNDTFKPVETNSDTLIVANEDDTPEQMNDNSNMHMEDLMNAEMDRDESLSTKYMKVSKEKKKDLEERFETANETERQTNNTYHKQMTAIMNSERARDLDISEKETQEYIPDRVDSVKQKNASSLSDSILHAETDREETLTDILFRPEAEFVELPRFEFLIAGKVNESERDGASKGRIEGDRNSSDVLRKMEYVELVELGKSRIVGNNSAYSLINITANEIDNDVAPDTRFTDTQTLFLACFATLLPLLAVLFASLLLRCICRRWCPGVCNKRTSSSISDSSEKQDSNHQQLKSPSGDTDEEGNGPASNGSIFTMTLKNNHLIVETEERNDIAKNGRETKMKYSPDNDGIFVVEVQQATAYRPTNKIPSSPPHDPQISTNQALIHRVAEELEKKIDEDSEQSEKFATEKALALSSTGLSISDLSMSSIGSHNVSYSYGSQLGYEQGPFGYPVYAGYDVSKEDSNGIIHDNSQEPLISKTPTDPFKPVVTAAIFKQDSIMGNEMLQGPAYCIEGSSDGPLLSDVQAREFSLQHLLEKKLENGVAVPNPEKIESPKKTFNRADSLPVRLENENRVDVIRVPIPEEAVLATITENDFKEELPKEMMKGKRPSLPIIRTDMYESVKDVMMPTGSPKFEIFMNDSPPGENAFDVPPMITISEESESKSDATS